MTKDELLAEAKRRYSNLRPYVGVGSGGQVLEPTTCAPYWYTDNEIAVQGGRGIVYDMKTDQWAPFVDEVVSDYSIY